MKIGLITVYFADYGSFYQAASLQNYLESSGHSCEIIRDDSRALRSPRLAIGKIGTKVLPKKIQKIIAKHIDVYRSYLALKNDTRSLNVSSSSFKIKSLSERYDCLIVGSDELWSATNSNVRFIPEYYGLNISCPIISYGTSGISMKNPPEEMMKKIKKGLESFKAISVRDEITADWVGKLLNREIDIVLDPTLLNPFFVGQKIETQPYIIVYGEQFSEKQINAIKAFSKERDLPLYGVVWKHSWCDKNLELESASQLQDYFKSASYAFSSTFHGTIFSILNHTDFTSFTTELRGKKVELLLKRLGLFDRLFDTDETISENSIDFDAVENRIQELRISSENYLKNALKLVEEEA